MEDNSFLETIETALQERVRPALGAHGGDIELLGYEDGVCRIRLLGACAHCPSARITTEEIVGEELKAALPQIRDVVLVEEVNPELLDFARSILNHQAENG